MTNSNDLTKYHDIRIHLKKVATVSDMIYKINQTKKLKKLYKKISKTEIELGDWHDKVLLNNSVNLFLKDKSKNKFVDLRKLTDKLKQENNIALKKFEKDVNDIVAYKL